MKLKPLGDRLIVQPLDEEQTTASGIVLPDTANEKPQRGKALAVGEAPARRWKSCPAPRLGGRRVIYSSTAALRSSSRARTFSSFASLDILALVTG